MTELLNGLMQGSVYALAAVGLTLIFGVVRVPHFAHGESLMLAGMVALVTTKNLGWPLLLGMLAGVLAAIAYGLVVGAGVFYPLRNYSETNLLIVALALVTITAAVAALIFGDRPRVIPGGINATVSIAGTSISWMKIIVFCVALLLFVPLHFWLRRSKSGLAMRAVALNPFASRLMGIQTLKTYLVVFGVGSALAGIAGVLLGTVNPVSASMGAMIALKSFVIIIFAGMGSTVGALVGGLVLGLVESFGGSFISSGYINSFAFVFLIIVLLVKPQGLFGVGAARD
ncbi:branched-chain amino acid ABC transporter permease [Cumulibacter soli]|uniref:branched-chain amino acid ABC transporter permease n=1 Tax=Cumulibacter soli TaxID=2546344 RepID=UPI00106896BF|nr:branched-chain amino acid ABC transporter permease [Cumulibacter soli]